MDTRLFAGCFLVVLVVSASSAQPLSTAFTYQGRLENAGSPANGLHDLRFRLYSAAEGGSQVGATLCDDNVSVVEGLFATPLDFGSLLTNTSPRHLEIEVRQDTGLDCSTAAGFVILAPRQAITAAPRAVAANTAFSLSAPDGSPANAVFVDNDGKVGIATAVPGAKLDIQASNGSNVLFGRRTGGGLAHNLYIDSAGNGSMQLLDAAAIPRIEFANGLTYFNYGNVGIGTSTPAATLDVRGNIRLGSSGQYHAASGEENLRIIRGRIAANGTILSGSGFTCQHDTLSIYEITFNPAFSGTPVVTATCQTSDISDDSFARIQLVFPSSVRILTKRAPQFFEDVSFHFIAVGPR